MTDLAPGVGRAPILREQACLPWEDPPRRLPPALSPMLVVDGFEGPLDWLLEMVRAKKIDLSKLSIVALVEAFVAASEAAFTRTAGAPAPELTQWSAWLVMVAQLVELRSRLLLPASPAEARAARDEAEALRERWLRRVEAAAAASWLERRPRLGVDVFARGRPEIGLAAEGMAGAIGAGLPPLPGETAASWDGGGEDAFGVFGDEPSVAGGDITELLRACLVVLRLPPDIEAYQLRPLPFWSVRDATERITRLLPGLADGAALEAFLPPVAKNGPTRERHCRAAVAATFAAALELSRDGAITLEQPEPWWPVQIQSRGEQVS